MIKIKFSNYLRLTLFVIIWFNISSCTKEVPFEIDYKLNPNGISPLTASIVISSEYNGTIKTKIHGDIPIEATHIKNKKIVELNLIGLYPNKENKVDVVFYSNDKISSKLLSIKTQELPKGLPDIQINKCDRSKMEPGFHACDFHLANHGKFKSIPFIFDDKGVIRWYLDLSYLGKMAGPFQRFNNGDIVVGTRTNILKYDIMGKTIKQINLNPQYGIHHDILEMPDQKILALVGKRKQEAIINGIKMNTDNDFTILIDKDNATILKEWDQAEILDVNRSDINTTRKNDWIHTNSLYFNPADSSIILSGKNQGVVKHTWDNELVWILAPHQNWGKSGRNGQGKNTMDFLLTAVDSNNIPYDDSIQTGHKSHQDFDFPWGQHACKLLPNGNLILFDNGSPRNYSSTASYSRVVEYEIDESKKTVKQIWEYGKKRGAELYSSIVSEVDYLKSRDNILMTTGNLKDVNWNQSAKIIEIDRSTNQEVFEATLFLKTLNGNKQPKWGQTDILYRSERMSLN